MVSGKRHYSDYTLDALGAVLARLNAPWKKTKQPRDVKSQLHTRRPPRSRRRTRYTGCSWSFLRRFGRG